MIKGKERRKTAGELSVKAKSDSTNYNMLELGHALCDDIPEQLRICIENHKNIIDEDEFCVVMQYALDPLISNVKRRKFYCWPYLPSPRPDQTVFLYNKSKDAIIKRLWCLPSAARMAQLASTSTLIPDNYKTMQAWSIAFFKGNFWEYVRYDQEIDLLSEQEYISAHREELLKAGCKLLPSNVSESFDFSKIHIKNVLDTEDLVAFQNCNK